MRIIAGDDSVDGAWRKYLVHLDGKEAKFVVAADDVAGTVIQAIVDDKFVPVVIDGDIQLVTRKGLVEFIPKSIETLAAIYVEQKDMFLDWGVK